MGKAATFKATYLKDGHLSIPKEIVTTLSLIKGEEVHVMIAKETFDMVGFLALFSIWKDKSEADISIYRKMVKQRETFGRAEVEL